MKKGTKKVTTPGGTKKTIQIVRKPKRPVCGLTGQKLHGVKTQPDSKNRNTAKSKKSVNRKYGGTLSSKASRRLIIARTRSKEE